MNCDDPIDDLGVNQRAVAGDSYNRIGAIMFRRLEETIQYVILVAAKNSCAVGAELRNRIVRRGRRSCDKHAVDGARALEAVHDLAEHRSPIDIRQDFAGQSGGAHPGLNDRYNVALLVQNCPPNSIQRSC